MKRMKGLPVPTDGELAILGVLWKRGPSTVREVLEDLCRVQPTGYTTALKMMQIMAAKGLLLRDESDRSHRYRPAKPEEETQRQLVGELVDRAFDGSARKLVLQALSTTRATREELDAVRKLLDEVEETER